MNDKQNKPKGKKDDVKLIVVVNGTSVHIKGDPEQPLSSLIELSLEQAKVADRSDLTRWSFKDVNGNVLDRNKLIGSFGFDDKATLFLSLEAGVVGGA